MSPPCPPQESPPCPPAVPQEGDDHPRRVEDFGGRWRAHEGGTGEPGELPKFWTPEHVGARMIEAVDVLFRTVGRVGPKSYGNAWPEFAREWEDLLDEDAWRNHQDSGADSRPKPDRFAVSRSDEALEWPMRILPTLPLQRDAIRLWAWGKARGREIEPIILKRKRRAIAMIPATLDRMNAERRAAACRRAAELTAEANRRCLVLARKGKLTPLRWANIDEDRHRAWEAERQAFVPLKIEQIALRHALPGLCLSPGTYHRMRKDACIRIAHALDLAEVAIR